MAGTPAISVLRRDKNAATEACNRERDAIESFAVAAGFEITAQYFAAGDEDLLTTAVFSTAIRRMERSGIHTLIIPSAYCLALNPVDRAVGFAKLQAFGIDVVTPDGSGPPVCGNDTVALVARILEYACNLEQVLKRAHLRGAAERLRLKSGPKWRKQYSEMHPEAVAAAKRHDAKARSEGLRVTLREISALLAEAGHTNNGGRPFHPQEISRMIKGPRPRPNRKGDF